MDIKEIILRFLGIQGVIIEDIKLFQSEFRAEVKVRQRRSWCFCRTCGGQYDKVHEWPLKKIKGPPLGIFTEVTIKFFQLRGWCEGCGHTGMADADWIHPKFESMTCSFAETAGRLMEEITCEAVSRILHCDSKTMWSLDQWRMGLMMERLRLPKDLDVSYLCADEVHFRTVRIEKPSRFICKKI